MESEWFVPLEGNLLISEKDMWYILDMKFRQDGIYRHTSCELASKMCVVVKQGDEIIYKSRW